MAMHADSTIVLCAFFIIQREDSGRCYALGGLIEDLEWSADCQAARRAPISLEGAEWSGGAES